MDIELKEAYLQVQFFCFPHPILKNVNIYHDICFTDDIRNVISRPWCRSDTAVYEHNR
jgi:hypothetical protein